MEKDYLTKLSVSYAHYLLNKHHIECRSLSTTSSEIITESLKKLKITYGLKTEHTTKKNNQSYSYNIWELHLPSTGTYDYLLFIPLEQPGETIKELGCFIFPSEKIQEHQEKKSITIFDSDLTGNYKKEPKFNKNYFLNNFSLLKH